MCTNITAPIIMHHSDAHCVMASCPAIEAASLERFLSASANGHVECNYDKE